MQHDDDNTPEQEDTFDLARLDELPASIVFSDADGPIIELSVYDGPPAEAGNRIEMDAEQRAAVSALLSQAPGLVQSGYIALTQTYRLTFAPGVAGRMASLMQAQGGGFRATAINAQGSIIANGVLHPANAVRVMGGVTAVWQVLSVITAQVYLAHINQRLARIERGVDDIRAWLEASHVGKIEVGLRYVREVATTLRSQDLSEQERVRIADQLEHIWRDCGQIARGALLMLNRAPAEFAALQLRALFRFKEPAALVHDAIVTYERRAYAYLLAEYVRCATIALRRLLQLNSGVSQHRLDELRGDLVEWRDSVRAFFLAVNERVRRDLSTFSPFRDYPVSGSLRGTSETLSDQQRTLLEEANQAAQRLIAFCIDVEQLRVDTQSEAREASDSRSRTLIVRLDERGQIAETYHVPHTDQESVLKPTRGQA